LDLEGATRNIDARRGNNVPIELDIQAVINNGAGGINKISRGTAALSGVNTYSGATAVVADSGTLLINGSITNGGVTVNNLSTLGGAGTIGGSVTIAGGGTVSPGAAVGLTGILTITANVNFAAGSRFLVDINGDTAGTQYDQLKVTNNVTITPGAAPVVTFLGGTTGGFGPTNGLPLTIINKLNVGAISMAGFNNAPQGGTVNIGGKLYNVTYVGGVDSNDLVLASIKNPNPAVWSGLSPTTNNWSDAANWVNNIRPAL
jgi:hypothetical protein